MAAILMTQSFKDIVVAYFQESAILNERNIQLLAKELDDIVDRHRKIQLLLNFNQVEYLSSAVLGKLVATFKKVQADGGRMKLCCIRASLLPVFQVTKLDKLFEIHDSEEKATAAFAKKGFFSRS